MPYIYKITNKINGKCYIGKTERTIEARWKEHVNNYTRSKEYNKPLYAAMRKYGIENFVIEEIEKIEETNNSSFVNEREIYWIEYYQSFKNGYNATLGGDGRHFLDYELICALYDELQSCKAVADKLNIDEKNVGTIVKANGRIVFHHCENVPAPKIINMYSLNDEYEQTFSSIQKAVEWCVEQGLCRSVSSGARSHIGSCAAGKRKTAYKHKWKYT